MQENKSIGKLTELLTQQKLIVHAIEPGVVIPNPYDAPPITLPKIKPWFPGVNPCGSNLADKESCEMCDKIAATSGTFGQINNASVRNKLIKAAEVIQSMCALLRGCSEKTSGNQYPWANGTACVCTAFKQLVQNFQTIASLAIIQPTWNPSAIKDINNKLLNQKKACIASMQSCFRLYEVSDNKVALQEIIKILNRYAVTS